MIFTILAIVYNQNELLCAACVLNYSRVKINSLKKSSSKKLGIYINNIIFSNAISNLFLPQYYDVILDLINSKFAPKVQNTTTKSTKSRPELICKIKFSDKHIQDIDLSRIFRDKSVLNTLPDIVPKTRPTIVYKYINPIRGKIFNYKQTMSELKVTEFIEDYDNISCKCDTSKYKDPNHNHIITGNLDIVNNLELKNLLKQGPQFREQPSYTNFKRLECELKYQIKAFAESWASKYVVPVEAFGEWKNSVFTLLKNKINMLKKNPRRPHLEVLKNDVPVDCLNKLHKSFVLAPVDKASNNISITCKKFYIKTILTEVGLWPSSQTSTYKIFEECSKQDILDKQFNFNSSNNIRDNVKTDDLPYIYAIPKFHKNPVKFRYIISSSKCQTKPLAQTITKGLKLCQTQHESWCRVLRSYTGINYFFIIDKNQPIIDTLNKISSKSKAQTIETFDFSTLYTMIKHEDLFENLDWFIEKAFNGAFGKGKSFMSIYSQEAKWISKPKSTNSSYFDKNSFQKIVHFLIENAIFEVGNLLIQQVIGIPMGTDPGPYMANAHLHKYEFTFQDNKRKTNYKVARSLNYTYRYIDDVTPINDGGNFSQFKNQIYPSDLILTKENNGNHSATVLDLDISIENGMFNVSVFDKTDGFNFEVVKYPSLDSNVPDNILYNVFYSQALRYLYICTDKTSFLKCLKPLFNKCKTKGATTNKLISKLKQLFIKKQEALLNLNITLQNTISIL